MSDLGKIIGGLEAAITDGRLGTGEIAELRRIDPESPSAPAFWRVLAAWISPDSTLSRQSETRWAIILSGMARMKSLTRGQSLSPGKAMAEAGFAEGRLTRLLRAEDTRSLAVQVRRVSTFLASKGISLNWYDFARFILTIDPDKREDMRRRIARDYYEIKSKEETSS